MTVTELLQAAKSTCPQLACASEAQKNSALHAMADAILAAETEIMDANALDLHDASGIISDVMLDRLALSRERIVAMTEGIRDAARLPDPVGRVLDTQSRPNGLEIQKISVPMGVVAMVYESRPNVTADAAALALKSGNACVLRGGKEAFRTAAAIVKALRAGVRAAGLPENSVSMVPDTSRESVNELMRAVDLVDLLIPRGGPGLIRACVEHALVPCIRTGTGICHVYVDAAADLAMALAIVENAKTSRPSVCNAAEVLLVHEAVATAFLPMLEQRLVDARARNGQVPVELRCDEAACTILGGRAAGADDFDTEFLDYILAVKVVNSVSQAVAHIAAHSTGHSEAIVTADASAAAQFTAMVDSAAVYVNASTRYTDGAEFGLGCEIGISTQKLHTRGPMGLEALTSYKYVIRGSGQIR